jgi:hypothetical protein
LAQALPLCLSPGKPAESEHKDLVTDPGRPESTAPRDKKSPKSKEETPLRSVLSAKDQKRVTAVVDKGIRFLKTSQAANGAWGPDLQNNVYQIGYTALPALTLLECGVSPQDEVIKKAAAYIRTVASAPADNGGPMQPRGTSMTYDLSLAIVFLDRLGDKQDEQLLQSLALRLVAGQTTTGGWTYSCPRLPAEEQKQLYSLLRQHKLDPDQPLDIKAVQPGKLVLEGGKPVPEGLKKLAVWRDGPDFARAPNKDESDNSNTQFAVLALWAAKRHDVPLQRTLALIVKRFRQGQNRSGSWGYTHRDEIHVEVNYPTMTCAGLLGLALGQGLMNEARAGKDRQGEARTRLLEDRAIQRGLEVLAEKIGRPTGRWKHHLLVNLYYLWSVERVGVIFNLKHIGGKDWYTWGSEILVANQDANGSWDKGHFHASHPVVNTSFALLFLKRANLAKDLTAKLQLGE